MNSECEGCNSFRSHRKVFSCAAESISQLGTGEICPCVTCLVKGICITACTEFKKFRDKYRAIAHVHKL